jgi:hypothetical protein
MSLNTTQSVDTNAESVTIEPAPSQVAAYAGD